MGYSVVFRNTDELMKHWEKMLLEINDPILEQRYIGFASVSAVTVFEMAIKEIFISFSEKKHNVFGAFAESHFERMNGRISLTDLRNIHIKRFGEKYLIRFNKRIEKKEEYFNKNFGTSVTSSYGNIISWRNKFVHTGSSPNTASMKEMKSAYELAKEVIFCLSEAMVR